MNIITKNKERLHELCKKYKVSRLYVFGSVVRDDFKEDSDIDFLVSFDKIELLEYANNYFDFVYSLEDLFRRKIDLLEEKCLSNPYLKKSIDNSKELVYGR